MQKLFFTIVVVLATLVNNAQTPSDAQKALDGKKLDKAKDIVDKLTADPNQKSAYAWLAKAQVYNALAEDEKFKTQVPDAYEQAFEAYKKAYEIDPNDNSIKLDFYKSPFISYQGEANRAAQAYQANNMPAANAAYKKTIEYGTWLNEKHLSFNNFSVPAVDTGMVFMAGFTAMKLDKNDEAIKYFSRLADEKIGKDPDYSIPYQYLASQYRTRKDNENFQKYLELGRQLYPNDIFFPSIRVDWARDNNNYPELFKGYEELIALQPDSINNSLGYATDIYNYLFVKNPDTRPADYDALMEKLATHTKRALSKNYEPAIANMIMAEMYYYDGRKYMDDADKIKSTKPEDVRKKNDLKANGLAKYQLGIPYAEAEVTLLEQKQGATSRDKQNLKNMYGILGDIYEASGNKAKKDEYDKKYSAIK